MMRDLILNVHKYVDDPPDDRNEGTICVSGDYEYWHYLCDGTDDKGWGCGYRTCQSIASWIITK